MLADLIYDFLIANPNTKYTATYIAIELDYSYTATLRALNRLYDNNLVTKEVEMYRGYYPDGENSGGGFTTVWSLNNARDRN